MASLFDFLKGGKKKKKSDFDSEFADTILTIYCHFIYKYLGRSLLNNKKFRQFFKNKIYNAKYENILKQANMKLMPEEYFISIYITIIFILIFSFILSFFFLATGLSLLSISFFYGGILLVVSMGIFLYNYPILISSTRGKEIDASLSYLLPYLKILAKEINLAKIIEIIDDFLIYKEIRIEFKRIKHYSNFLGYDIHSSIREAMLSCPSRQLSDIMNDLVTITNSGGDIYGYLDRKLSHLNSEIDAIEKKNIDTLLIYSQIYVVVLLIAPLFFTIMTSILSLVSLSSSASSMGSVAGGGISSSYSSVIMLLVFLPLAYVGFMMLVYYSKPLYSRLKPVKNV